MKTPIFIITCDRITALTTLLNSYRKVFFSEPIKSSYEIVIHDNGSTFPPMLTYLKSLTESGVKVYGYPPLQSKEDLNKVNHTVQMYFSDREPSEYVVTDCDIILAGGKESLNILILYKRILEILPNINVVGPSLIIDDIPDYYPNKARVQSIHKKFWPPTEKRKTLEVRPNKGDYYRYRTHSISYIEAPIDTTFGMYRAGSEFKRHQSGIRTFSPYVAQHFDWYINPDNMTPDQEYYSKHCSRQITHWGIV